MEEKPKYNVQRHRAATIRSSIRAAAALYLAYLGYGLIRDRGGDSSIPVWGSVAAGAAFFVIAAAIGLYAWRQYKVDLKDAEVQPEERVQEQLPDNEGPEQDDEEQEP